MRTYGIVHSPPASHAGPEPAAQPRRPVTERVGGIVAGVTGSAAGEQAVAWAAEEAALRGCPLHLVHTSLLLAPGALGPAAARRLGAEHARLLDRAAEVAHLTAPGVTVTVEARAADPGEALVELGRTAQLLVVGGRGLSGINGVVVGSVSQYVAGHAGCPVVVVGEPALEPVGPESSGSVVLGVDGHDPVGAATAWAFAEAARRRVGLVAVYARGLLKAGWEPGEAAAELDRALAPYVAAHPRVAVTRRLADLGVPRALVAESQEAALLVVGAHRRTGHHRPALSLVNHAVLHYAWCPVAVVPETPPADSPH